MPENLSEAEQTDLIPGCPECGEPARGTLEEVQGVALVMPDPETGKPVCAGGTDVAWDSQQTVQGESKPVCVCAGGHDWPADVIAE